MNLAIAKLWSTNDAGSWAHCILVKQRHQEKFSSREFCSFLSVAWWSEVNHCDWGGGGGGGKRREVERKQTNSD